MKSDRVYKNSGNAPLIDLVELACQDARILDVGCGAGDNASLLRAKYPNCTITGITNSEKEASIASAEMTSCRVIDVEMELPQDLAVQKFDVIVFCHILEHLRYPALVLSRFACLLDTGGTVVIAVLNVLSWPMRWKFVRGDFEYESAGVLDDTHLRFFTFQTADKYLLSQADCLKLVAKRVTDSVPLWLLRRYVLPTKWAKYLDQLGCRLWPNLFGGQIELKAVKR